MTSPSSSGATSMRYSLDEVFSGMLASVASDKFTNNAEQLAKFFESLAAKFPMFAPFAAGVDPAAVGAALTALVSRKVLEKGADNYALTENGRAMCTSSKRTLFNQRDRLQLEEAAKVFEADMAA